MIRTSKHSLKFSNKEKLNQLNILHSGYTQLLQTYVDMICSKSIEHKSLLSSKELPDVSAITHSRWKQVAYKQASEIVSSNLQKTKKKVYNKFKYLYRISKENNNRHNFTNKRFNELNIDFYKRLPNIHVCNVVIPIDERLFNISNDSFEFDEFIRLTTPYFKEGKRRAKTFNIPIKYHRQSNKFIQNNFKRKNTILLRKNKDTFYLDLFWEKNDNKTHISEKEVGIDIGYKKLISVNNGSTYGKELYDIYKKISNKKQGSKSFKRSLIERNEMINYHAKQFIYNENPGIIYIENLKNVKHKSKGKIHKTTMNKMQRWSYSKLINKLVLLSEEEGFLIKKVNPAYTSQTCSKCGNVDKLSRKVEKYQCVNCGITLDADVNASINILRRGKYGVSTTKNISL